jgi:hypothetical protein
MLKPLKLEQIAPLSARKDVSQIAVENFLMTVQYNETLDAALENLMRDAASYGWNAATIKAIRAGIHLAAKV